MTDTPHILVMGGAGYIGSHTVRHLLDRDCCVVVADNLIYGHREAVYLRAAFEHASLLRSASLNPVFQKYSIAAEVHSPTSAYVSESVANPAKYYRNNVAVTPNLLGVMREHEVNKNAFSSTCATYDKPRYTPIDEEYPQTPINPYGHSELMIGQVFADYERVYGLRHISLRYFNVAGAATNGVSMKPAIFDFRILEKMPGLHRECKNILFNIVRHCYLLLIVMVGWVMFRADTLTYAWHYLLTMFGMETAMEEPYKLLYYADRLEVITLVVGIIGAVPVFSRMIEVQNRSHVRIALVSAWLLILFVLSASFMEASTYNPFIYFRF